jgi:diacylglycerol kinase (ATP)
MADSSGSAIPRGPGGVLRAMRWSMLGLRAAWRVESSFRLEVYLAVVMVPAGWWFGGDAVERVLMIGSVLLVLVGELLNSALEAAVDRFGPERHELVGRAKDMGSAAVFMLMVNVVVCWSLLLLN